MHDRRQEQHSANVGQPQSVTQLRYCTCTARGVKRKAFSEVYRSMMWDDVW